MRSFVSALLLLVCSVIATPRPCITGSPFPWCDHTKPIDARVASLVANLTISEKSGLFVNKAAGVPRIGWPKYNWWSEALHGVARDGVATSFAQIGLIGASYNRTLWNKIGDVTATEGRGMNNGLRGGLHQGLTFWAPNINIFRDPRWGRGQETPGEDPHMNGEYAAAFVPGMQGNESSGYLKVSACLKHFAAYSEEQDRHSFPAMVTSQDMEDSYLPAFQAGVEKAHPSGLMCSYNAESFGEGLYGTGTQGGAIPSCANKGILNDLARDQWHFDGYITSDCAAVADVQEHHHYTSNQTDTVMATLDAGMDSDCGVYMSASVMSRLMQQDRKTLAAADHALQNLFKVQFRLGMADPPELVPWSGYGPSVVNTPEHQRLAKEASDQSIVLLKNAKQSLPLSQKAGLKIAVLGRNAKATTNMQGNYFGTAPYLVSPAQGLAAYGTVSAYDGSSSQEALGLVVDADAVVLVVGLTSEAEKSPDEAEGHDRTSLLLPGSQNQLVAQVAAAARKKNVPVVMVIMSGGPVDVSAAKGNPDVGAILWCGYPGQSGGSSIADVIFGKVNPSGRLSMTWYPEEFTKQVALKDMGMRPNATTGNPGRTYRFYTRTPVFHFGEGLSYTSFHHNLIAPHLVNSTQPGLTLSQLSKQAPAVVSVDSVNAGERDGDEVILVFAAPPGAGEGGRPLRSLVAFEKVSLKSGEAKTTRMEIAAQHFTVATETGDRVAVPGAWSLWIGPHGEGAQVVVQLA